MRALVIYSSQFGNTQKIAETIATALSARAVEIGALDRAKVAEADLVILGAPTQGHSIHPPMKEALRTLDAAIRGKRFAAFDTRLRGKEWLTGSAAKGIDRRAREAGAIPAGPPGSFLVTGTQGPLVEGEIERAATWARSLTISLKGAPSRAPS